MNYTITPSEDGKYIILKVIGDVNRKTMLPLNLEAHALGKQLQVRRYMVDATEARNTETSLESYEFAYVDMQEMAGIDRYARVALLVSTGDHSHDFVETVSRNAGLNVKKFTTPDQARRFLMDGNVVAAKAAVDC